MKTPFKHQQKILDIIKDKDRYGIFLSPGLGKTFITLKDWYDSDKKYLLVLTLTSMLETWKIEAESMDYDVNVVKLDKGSKKNTDILLKNLESDQRCIFIVSHATSWRMEELLKIDKKNVFLAIDESHMVKNRKSKQSKCALKLANRYGKVRLLTGTPMSIGWEDYYWPLKILGEEDQRVRTVAEFEKNFLLFETSPYLAYRKLIGPNFDNLDTLKEIIAKKTIHMSEKESGIILPEQIEKTFYIEIDKDFKKAMKDKVYGTWMIKNSGSKLSAHRTGLSGFLYGTGKYGERIVEKFNKQPKIDMFKAIIQNLDSKVLVFYNFEQELEDLKNTCKDMNKTWSQITKENVDITGDIVLAHYRTGSTGHNLQEINHILYYSPTIIGSDFIQSKKRIHRIGQNKTCFYYYLLTKGTVEEKIFDKIKNNQNYTEEMFENEEE